MSDPLSIVYWLYPDPDGYRRYTAEHVNAQLPMLKKHCDVPYRVVCVTDHADGIDPSVEVIPDPVRTDGAAEKRVKYPPCMRRIWNFSKEARRLGRRILSLDLDGLLCRAISPLVARDEPLVVWRNQGGRIMGGAYLLETGTHAHVWDQLDLEKSPLVLAALGFQQSDQGWLNYVLPRSTPSWVKGLYIPQAWHPQLPADARIVSFMGDTKPWMSLARMHYSWLPEHYPQVANA